MNNKQLTLIFLFLRTTSMFPSALENDPFNLFDLTDILQDIGQESAEATAQPIAIRSEAEQKELDRELFWAIVTQGNLGKVRDLVIAGANPARPNEAGTIPLFLAFNKPDILTFAVTQNPRLINLRKLDGTTLIHGCISFFRGIFKSPEKEAQTSFLFLLHANADIKIPTHSGTTTLHTAACITHQENVALVLDALLRKAESQDILNSQDHNGNTPLHVALLLWFPYAYHNVPSLPYSMRALLRAGASLDIPNNEDLTVRTLAERRGISDWLQLGTRTKPALKAAAKTY